MPLPALSGFGDLIPVATGVDEWELTIERLLQPESDTPERSGLRRAEARRHDWNVIVDEIARSLAQRLALPERRP
jgi:hypothetical protein